jgi:hypothetical protein
MGEEGTSACALEAWEAASAWGLLLAARSRRLAPSRAQDGGDRGRPRHPRHGPPSLGAADDLRETRARLPGPPGRRARHPSLPARP